MDAFKIKGEILPEICF